MLLSALLAAASVAAHAADPTTARSALQEATSVAQKWQPDAVLTGVSGLQATPDGKARKWGYMFYSPGTNKAFSVDFAGTKRVDQMEVRPHMRDAVAAQFVDSDKAFAVARENGVDTKGKPYILSLLVMGQPTRSPAAVWTVGGGFTPGAVAVVVDARTGKFLFKQELPK
jgi:hypothetical protein